MTKMSTAFKVTRRSERSSSIVDFAPSLFTNARVPLLPNAPGMGHSARLQALTDKRKRDDLSDDHRVEPLPLVTLCSRHSLYTTLHTSLSLYKSLSLHTSLMNASFDMTLPRTARKAESEVAWTASSSWDADEEERSAASRKKRSSSHHPMGVIHDSKLPATPSARRHRSSPFSAHPLLFLEEDKPILSTSSSLKRRKSKRSLGTCTTVTAASSTKDHSCLTTDLHSSVDTTQEKNFRFTSFPASLPRIHAPMPPLNNKLLYAATSNNNDSHNTSLSSWNCGMGYSSDDDELLSSPFPQQQQSSFHSTPRARLNFNPQEEEENEDLLRLPKMPLSSHHSSNDNDDDETCSPHHHPRHRHCPYPAPFPRHTLLSTPRRSVFGLPPHDEIHCSPIPDIPEEEGTTSTPPEDSTDTPPGNDDTSSSHSYSTVRCRRLVTATTTPLTPPPYNTAALAHSPHSEKGLIAAAVPTSAQRPLPDMHAFQDGGGPVVMEHSTTDALSSSSISSSTSRSSGDTLRRLSTTAAPLSPKLLCPPTPVRVHPMFRDEDALQQPLHHHPHLKLARSNSLIANKVLATCSPQLLLSSNQEEMPRPDEVPNSSRVREKEEEMHRGRPTSLPTFHSTAAEATTMKSLPPPPTVVSLISNFQVLSTLGSGAFADVYKVVSRRDGRTYAIKRNRRQFRSKKEREAALSEVRSMQRIQSHMSPTGGATDDAPARFGIYLLFFYQAWQEDGHILCQTELCCRDTCREMIDTVQSWNATTSLQFPTVAAATSYSLVPSSLSGGWAAGMLLPESVIWKICHDISAGLAFIHSKKVGLVHNDIKPSNILFVQHQQFGALCKIGDFGMARDIGTLEDGQEGDQKYMTLEVLQSGTSYPSADIFSLGLTLYEMATHAHVTIPSDGPRWHELRSGIVHASDYPAERSLELRQLIASMMHPNRTVRPSADAILSMPGVVDAGTSHHPFLRDYVHDVERLDQQEEEQWANHHLNDEQTPQNARPILCSPPLHQMPPLPFAVLRSTKETALALSS